MRIKMCGMKTIEAAKAAENAGADFLGFIFHRPSRRYVEPETARDICREIKHCKTVGVFVDEEIQRVNDIAQWCGFDFIQLHGHEDENYAKKVERPVIKAFRWGEDFSLDAASRYPAKYLLLDSYNEKSPGGTGQTFAWQEAAKVVEALEKEFFLAGGISEANAAEAIGLFHPYGLDVSGSLEEQGEKSPERIKRFMEEIKRLEGLS